MLCRFAHLSRHPSLQISLKLSRLVPLVRLFIRPPSGCEQPPLGPAFFVLPFSTSVNNCSKWCTPLGSTCSPIHPPAKRVSTTAPWFCLFACSFHLLGYLIPGRRSDTHSNRGMLPFDGLMMLLASMFVRLDI
jgi:hypothetical protein